MLPDDPAELIAGKHYGAEGTAQRYVCALLINGSAYGYHKSWPLSDRGTRFVERLYERSFGPAPAGAPQFWNERNLLAVDGDDKHAVDYAFLWPKVQFLVELKTLGASHRPGQLAEYLRRAHHHNPEQSIDLLYLTQPMTAASPDHIPERCRYAHIGWPDALEIAEPVWGDSEDPREIRCLALLREHLQTQGALAELSVNTRPTTSRRAKDLGDLPEQWQQVVGEAVVTAAQAAAGRRMAVEISSALAGDDAFEKRLNQVKLLLEAHLAASPGLVGVKVWWWTPNAGGRAYTETGARVGMELRLSPPS